MIKLRLASWRWALPILLMFGYLITFSYFSSEELAIRYLMYMLFSVAALCLLLTRLNKLRGDNFVAWALLFVFFLAYFFKFFWVVRRPDILDLYMEYSFKGKVTEELLLNLFAVITYAFITYCLTCWWLIRNFKIGQFQIKTTSLNYRRLINWLVWILPLMLLSLSYIMFVYGIGKKGALPPNLPFHLAGIIFNLRQGVLPLLMFLFIWCSEQLNLRKYSLYGVFLLFIFSVTDVIIRSSKGGFIGPFMTLGVLLLFMGRIKKLHIYLFVFVIMVTIVMTPFIREYRGLRARAADVDYALVRAYSQVSFSGEFFESVASLLFRFTGIEALSAIIASDPKPLGLEIFNRSASEYYKVDVLDISPLRKQGVGTSFLGWFYLVGGKYFVIPGVFLYVIFAWFVLYFVGKLDISTRPLIYVFYSLTFYSMAMDGNLDKRVKSLLIGVVLYTGYEIFVRIASKKIVFKAPQTKPQLGSRAEGS